MSVVELRKLLTETTIYNYPDEEMMILTMEKTSRVKFISYLDTPCIPANQNAQK